MTDTNLHLGACLKDGKLFATVMRREPNDHITVVATAEIHEDYLRASDCHAVMQAPPQYMPILGTQLLLPMRLLNERQAQANHGQTLARLAQRGGVSLAEAACIASCCKFGPMTDERAHELLKRAAQRL